MLKLTIVENILFMLLLIFCVNGKAYSKAGNDDCTKKGTWNTISFWNVSNMFEITHAYAGIILICYLQLFQMF